MANKLPAGGRKPRAAKSSTTPASSAAPPAREAAIGDNSAAIEEAERVQLISFVSKLTAAESEVEKAKAPFDAAKKALTQIFRLAKAAGFSRKQLERYLEKMGDSTRDVAAELETERKHFKWLGILDEDQAKLQLGDAAPQEHKDEFHWRAEGYKAGLRQLERKPPPECPERFVQPWLQDYDRGLQTVLEANVPKPMTVREQAAADFKADNPDAPEPGSPEAAAAERKSIAAAKESLANMGSADPEAPFEATEEELAGQSTRQAVQEARTAEDVI